MSRRKDTVLQFDAIAIEGGLLPAEWLAKAAALQAPHQAPTDYGIPKGLNLRDELGRNWRIAEAHWNEFAATRLGAADSLALTQRFVTQLLREVFGVIDIAASVEPQTLDEHSYPLAALACAGRLPLVVAAHDQRLEDRDRRFGDGGRQRSAFGLLQDYLNAADTASWGIASNGRLLRLARDNASLTRPAWIEADLERIFTEQRFADFSLLWLLIHTSRFGQAGQPPEQCALEAWYAASREQGTRARKQLRAGVEEALKTLGQGFLSEAENNNTLRQRLARGELTPDHYFQQLLRLVYRLIFLLTIEERGLLHPVDAVPEAIRLYQDGYSLRRLRERARRRRAWDRHVDLWQGLKPVFTGLASGQPQLALPALGGLFAADQCPDVDCAVLGNSALLAAVHKLAWMRNDGSLTRINWRDMGPEELGSVYESLLELVPQVAQDGRVFRFANADQSQGNARKTSGSYYTPDSLVQELLDSALEPVIRQRIAGATDPQAALLSITICDPACGSGHFLIAAARRMASQLAQLRAHGTPSGDDYRHALRDVIGHCIYGVDINPLALELARMSLWLEAMTPDMPLGFLDHHLQCGDALLGLTDLAAMEFGIPKDAYKPLSGDEIEVCKALAKTNAVELKDLTRKREARAGGQQELLSANRAWLTELRTLEQMAESSLQDIAAKQVAWHRFLHSAANSPLRHAADMLVAAYLMPKTARNSERIPTTSNVMLELLEDLDQSGHADKRIAAQNACEKARVLHWPLAFPLIEAAGGFACVLGNPPWEVSQMGEEEFFASRAPEISALAGENRKRAIAALEAENPRLWQAYLTEDRRIAAVNAFFRASGRYPLTAVGKLNTYPLFAETIDQIVADVGRAGFIVPTGIATDDGTKAFFTDIVQRQRLVSIRSFENEEFVFPDVHHAYRFCLMTLGSEAQASFVFFARQPMQIHDERRCFRLTADEFKSLNANTLTCPVFRSGRDAELTKKLYRAAPVLIDENSSTGNPWGIRFSQGLFNMTSDSELFVNAPGTGLSPLYEAKLIHQFDHRWATYTADGDSRDVTIDEKVDPAHAITPRYWVRQTQVAQRLVDKNWQRDWLMGWRDITGVEKIRTMIASVAPRVGVGHTMPLFMTVQSAQLASALLANLNSLVLDFVARVKVGGTHLTYGYLKQFPVLPPERYTEIDLAFIVPRVLELTYTSHDLAPWAQDLGYDGSPFSFDPQRRAILRADLDAYYARLYGLSREELRYILDPADIMGEDYPSETFRVLKNKELIPGTTMYRTQQLVLEAWDALASGIVCSPASYEQPAAILRRRAPYSEYQPDAVPCCEAEDWLAGLVCDLVAQSGPLFEQDIRMLLVSDVDAGEHFAALAQWRSQERLNRLPLVMNWLRGLFKIPIGQAFSVSQNDGLKYLLGDERTNALASLLRDAFKQHLQMLEVTDTLDEEKNKTTPKMINKRA